jgi:hypothetical protein
MNSQPRRRASAMAPHHGVLQRHAAECQHDLGLGRDLLPGHIALGDVFVARQDLRQQHRRCARRIGVDRAHIAAHRDVQEAVNLALGVMKAARAGPAVGAAKDRTGTADIADAHQLATQQVERLFPAHRNVFVAAAAVVGTGATLEPAASDCRLGNARLVAQRAGKIVNDTVRIGIAGIRPDFESRLAVTRRKHAPVRGVRLETIRQVEARVRITNGIVHSVVPLRARSGATPQFEHLSFREIRR